MSIFDFFGGTNKFKKGMEAGAKPFEAKFEQHSEALKRLENNFGSLWNSSKEVADKIVDSIEETERERLYGLYTQTDIKQLKSEYKEILIAALYTLNTKSNNELQQCYIRSVQKYLDIKNPQTSIDFAGIENIDSQNAQKAIFQSCVEYLLLGYGSPAFFKEYGENLFSLFIIKEKDKEQIWDNVLQIYSAAGPSGLSEKYGFVPEFKDKSKVLSGQEKLLPEYPIDDILHILPSEETVIENKEILLRDDIKCEGKLVLRNCILRYNGDNIRRQILLGSGATLVLEQCTIIGKNNEERNQDSNQNFFIKGEDKYKEESSKVIAEKCVFLNCLNFADRIESIFKQCIIRYTCISIYKPKVKGFGDTKFDISFLSYNVKSTELYGCIIEADENIMDAESYLPWLSGILKMENCTAKNLRTPFAPASSYDNEPVNSNITNSRFVNCQRVISNSKPCIITDCVFENCSDVLNLGSRSKVSYCQFVHCGDTIIEAGSGATIEKCEFYNVKQPDTERSKYQQNHDGICLTRYSDGNEILLRNCVFDGINYARFISYSNSKKPLFAKNSTNIGVENCVFKHCVAGVIDKKNYDSKNSETAITIKNCTGLEQTGGGQAENIVIRQTTDSGEPIGTSIEESEVGVPIYQTA